MHLVDVVIVLSAVAHAGEFRLDIDGAGVWVVGIFFFVVSVTAWLFFLFLAGKQRAASGAVIKQVGNVNWIVGVARLHCDGAGLRIRGILAVCRARAAQ